MPEATYFKAPTAAELTGYGVTGKDVPTFGCEKDADCYVAVAGNPMFATAATTDADKAKRCCAYFGDIKLPAALKTMAD